MDTYSGEDTTARKRGRPPLPPRMRAPYTKTPELIAEVLAKADHLTERMAQLEEQNQRMMERNNELLLRLQQKDRYWEERLSALEAKLGAACA